MAPPKSKLGTMDRDRVSITSFGSSLQKYFFSSAPTYLFLKLFLHFYGLIVLLCLVHGLDGRSTPPPSTSALWSFFGRHLHGDCLTNSQVTNESQIRAWAQSSGQTWNLLGNKDFLKKETKGTYEYGRVRAGHGAPYLCTANPAVRGPRARTHSGRRRWGPCSCGYQTCGAC